VKKHSVLCLGLGLVLSFGFSVGCSSDNNSSADAGKRDGAAGKDGGKGGSTGTGVGGSGSGGSATGGSFGSGGASGTGGSASGGSSGTGGSSGGATGTGGTIVGGSSGTGGTATGGASGTGGAIGVDAGSVDVGGSDSLDAPILDNDAAIDSGALDTGTVSLLDAGTLDVADDAPAVDMAAALDMGIDISPVDMSGVDSGNLIPCDTVHMISLDDTGGILPNGFGTTGSYCIATCDDIQGWGASNMAGRSLLLINGQQIDLSTGVGSMPLPTPKVMDTYTVFQVSAGTYDYARVYWWGTAHVCAAPAGGFGLN
jgi:hypothetical protein